MMKEIKGFEGLYSVEETGKVFSHIHNKYLKGRIQRGYYKVGLYDHNGVMHEKAIHILVATYFVDNPFNYPEVNHLNGNKLDCAATNLEWTTTSGNAIHAYQLGLRKYNPSEFRKSQTSKACRIFSLPEEEQIKRICAIGISQRAVAAEFGVNRMTILRIVNNQYSLKAVTR